MLSVIFGRCESVFSCWGSCRKHALVLLYHPDSLPSGKLRSRIQASTWTECYSRKLCSLGIPTPGQAGGGDRGQLLEAGKVNIHPPAALWTLGSLKQPCTDGGAASLERLLVFKLKSVWIVSDTKDRKAEASSPFVLWFKLLSQRNGCFFQTSPQNSQMCLFISIYLSAFAPASFVLRWPHSHVLFHLSPLTGMKHAKVQVLTLTGKRINLL